MTLDERIAKRKADGWVLSHWVVKSGGEYYNSTENSQWTTYRSQCERWGNDKHASRFIAVNELKAKVVPVFTRTIRTKRGHGFGWALARMKEGKTVMRIGNPSRLAMREGWLIDFYNNTKVQSIASEAIEANTWELSE